MRILYVEDDQAVAKAIFRLCAAEGYAVTLAPSVLSAITMIESGADFDVVLLDLGLPGVSGVDAVRKMREATQQPIVIYTGGVSDAQLEKAVEAGADFWLEKAGDFALLRRTLRIAVHRDQLGRHFGGVERVHARLLAIERNGVILGFCKSCDKVVFLVDSNLGDLRCPHCSIKVSQTWGRCTIILEPSD